MRNFQSSRLPLGPEPSIGALTLAGAFVLPLILGGILGVAGGASDHVGPPAPRSTGFVAGVVSSPYTVSRVNYTSSVDGFPLSYSETIPSNFSASKTYPLAIELHGLSGVTIPQPGGLYTYLDPSTQLAAAKAGIILMDPNTRTGAGWYINSKFTGPQEQDILDALAKEQTHRHIGSVYLFGESMGSIGTYEIGLDHPSLFKGIGVDASFSDYFEMYSYLQTAYPTLAQYMLLPAGGHLPNATAYSRGIFYHLSSSRFHSQNFSGLRVYVANGAQDVLSTNNLTLWPYQQANNTIVNSTCLVALTLSEPLDCTVPLAERHALAPSDYPYRYVFVPNGPHAYDLMNTTDLFAFFLGQLPSGTFWGNYPVPHLVAPPEPLVTIATSPRYCGGVSLGATAYTSGEAPTLHAGNYSLSVSACGNLTLLQLHFSGAVQYHPRLGTLSILGSGAIVARFG